MYPFAMRQLLTVNYCLDLIMKVWVPTELSAQVNLGCDSHQTIHNYNLYVATFLGFGGNAARDRYTELVITQNKTLDTDV